MAKHLYEEERIKDIAKKIRELAPGLRDGLFTTSEMPNGIERVFEEGERKGRTAGFTEGYGAGFNSGILRGKDEGYTDGYNKGHEVGYDKGYSEGAEDNQGGVDLPTLTNPGTATDLVEGKQLIDGEGNIVEGTVPLRTATDLELETLSQFDLGLAVAPGYYGEGVTKIIGVKPYYDEGQVEGYSNGYNVGLADGVDKVKTEEARTSSDVTHSVSTIAATVTIPSGYYAKEVKRVLDVQDGDLDPIVDAAYDEGAEVGYNNGYNQGSAVGYNKGYDQGFEHGLAAGGTYEDGNEVKY